MSLQILNITFFKPHCEQNTVAQRWSYRKNYLNYFIIKALSTIDRGRNQAPLMQLASPETQNIYELLNQTENSSFDKPLTTLYIQLEIQKIYYLNIQYSVNLTKNLRRVVNNSLHIYENLLYTDDNI